MTETVIFLDELLAAADTVDPCPDCAGGLAAHVGADGDWTVVPCHDVTCVHVPAKATANGGTT